jgi:hypothetical protein
LGPPKWRNIEIFDTAEELAHKAAEIFTLEAEAATLRRSFSVALSEAPPCAPLFNSLKMNIAHGSTGIMFTSSGRMSDASPYHPDSNFRLAFDLLIFKAPHPRFKHPSHSRRNEARKGCRNI